jgi:ribonuclease Z
VPRPVRRDPADREAAVVVAERDGVRISARPLDHRVDCFGYRLQEADGRRMLPERLAALGVHGPAIRALLDHGQLSVEGRLVRLEEVSEPRPGQSFALVMDTRPCRGAEALAQGVDLLVCESTFTSEHAEEADAYHHMTAAQAATLARTAGVRTLALTHFSQRYTRLDAFASEASAIHPQVVIAQDFTRVAVPSRLAPGAAPDR